MILQNSRSNYQDQERLPQLITNHIQDVSRLVEITAGGDFLGLCDQKSSYKHVSDFGRLRSYGHFLIPVHALV
jgi:hypothetical protein